MFLDSTNSQFVRKLKIEKSINKLLLQLITARITPFGDSGPQKDFKASDLIYLTLGGVMTNYGYDMNKAGQYELPPIAPQIWHSYHITAKWVAVGIAAALVSRQRTHMGQDFSSAVHGAVAKKPNLI